MSDEEAPFLPRSVRPFGAFGVSRSIEIPPPQNNQTEMSLVAYDSNSDDEANGNGATQIPPVMIAYVVLRTSVTKPPLFERISFD